MGRWVFVSFGFSWLNKFALLAYYNAGSAVLVLLLSAIAIALCIWCRLRRRPIQLARGSTSSPTLEEEHIPLTQTSGSNEAIHREGKGKSRAIEEGEAGTTVFDVGEDDYPSDDDQH